MSREDLKVGELFEPLHKEVLLLPVQMEQEVRGLQKRCLQEARGKRGGVKLSDKTGSCGKSYKRSFTKPLEMCGKTWMIKEKPAKGKVKHLVTQGKIKLCVKKQMQSQHPGLSRKHYLHVYMNRNHWTESNQAIHATNHSERTVERKIHYK